MSHKRQSNIVIHLYSSTKKFHYSDKLWELTPVKLSDRKELFTVHNEQYRHLAHIIQNTSFWKEKHIPQFEVPSMLLWHNSYRRMAAIRYVHMHITNDPTGWNNEFKHDAMMTHSLRAAHCTSFMTVDQTWTHSRDGCKNFWYINWVPPREF